MRIYQLCLVLLLLSCASQTLSVRSDFKPQDHKRVAIAPFQGEADEEDQRGTLEGGIEQSLITCGMDIIERGRVAELYKERSEGIDYAEIGKVLGVTLIITGAAQFSAFGSVEEVTYRGVETESGRIVFSGSLGGGGKPEGNGRDLGEEICKVFGKGEP
jgi:hypothetical protein